MKNINIKPIGSLINRVGSEYSRLKPLLEQIDSSNNLSASIKALDDALKEYKSQREVLFKLNAAGEVALAGVELTSDIEAFFPPNVQKELDYDSLRGLLINLSKYVDVVNEDLRIVYDGGHKDISSEGSHYVEVLKSIADETSKSINNQSRELKRLILDSDDKISNLGRDVDNVKIALEEELVKIRSSYKSLIEDIESKRDQIDDMLGHVSGRVIAGDYESSALEEKDAADKFRGASLACMAIGIAFLVASLWESVQGDFDWKKSLFRMILAFLISVPAAYLARESAKHRQQQYQHLQTSLDLKAITPYMASLPLDEQHKLKVSIAARIFSAKDFSYIGKDPYPLNSQEIIMALINRVESNPSNSKSKSDNSSQ